MSQCQRRCIHLRKRPISHEIDDLFGLGQLSLFGLGSRSFVVALLLSVAGCLQRCSDVAMQCHIVICDPRTELTTALAVADSYVTMQCGLSERVFFDDAYLWQVQSLISWLQDDVRSMWRCNAI